MASIKVLGFQPVHPDDTEAHSRKQPDASAIFEKHVELSTKPTVAGYQGNLWVFDGKDWKCHGTVSAEAWAWLQKAMKEHGTQTHATQWEFPEGFVFECFKPAQVIRDLGFKE
jgi:hypothetical protein